MVSATVDSGQRDPNQLGARLRERRETLGISGVLDVIEEKSGEQYPVETKHGSAPHDDDGKPTVWENDAVQLCAQAMLMEEAFGKPVLDFQNTRFTLADLKTKLQVGWAHLDWALNRHAKRALTPEEGAAAKLGDNRRDVLRHIEPACQAR